jgi:hypothetical protein
VKRFFLNIKKRNWIIFLIVSLIYAGNIFCSSLDYSEKKSTTENTDPDGFAGAAACKACHKNIYDSCAYTAHYLTSRPASKEFIKGSFDSGKNSYQYNKFMYVEMENVGDSFYQTAMVNNSPLESEPFDIVIGSGRKGQTYLYWNDAKLFQLPVSYYTALKSWCNSPGYPSTIISFNRQVNAQCLECHGTYAKAKTTSEDGSLFDKSRVIYGIECERCHGAAAEHVAYYNAHPKDTVSKFIINAKYLSRQQRLDACALCHSGLRKETRPAFSFQVGDKLDDFSNPDYNADSTAMLDVHGNQYGLLTSSKCFRMSQMDCSSCHNVHVNETGNVQVFLQRCLSCHNNTTHDTCTLDQRKRIMQNNNCIDCHMPLLPSKKIFLQLADRQKSTADLVRTHRIAVYSKETKNSLIK